jgi:uncharacterized protein (TIGR02145 family)
MGEHPVFGIASFATDKTWVTGSLTWSDAVVATRCQKEDYDGGVYGGPFNVDCRKSSHGDMFSWEAVNQNQDFLCPDEWRVPTSQDFSDLDIALNGGDQALNRNNNWDSLANYTDPEKWDARYSGYAYDGRILNEGMYGYFWSVSSAPGSGSATFLGIYDNPGNGTCMTHPNASGGFKYLGLSLRCVK